MSGAGRTEAANSLEDLDWFVMDNLPPSLLPKVAELARPPGTGADKLALVVGTSHYHGEIVDMINGLRADISDLKIVFLDASNETLVRRYELSRRRHPVDDVPTLADAIASERAALEPVLASADVVIDTTDLNVHQLRDRMAELFDSDSSTGMHTTVMSFGYKHGIPRDVDIVIDCRFLPNPHWVEDLRPLTGRDTAVVHYLTEHQITTDFLSKLDDLIELLLPHYVAAGKSYLTIAFGCTGGRHRSVAVVEHLADVLRGWGHNPAVAHRDLSR